MSDDDKYSAQHSVSFTETAWHDRVRKIASFLPRQVPLFAAVTVSFWGVAEVLAELGGDTLSLRNLAGPALATAFTVVLYKAIQCYIYHVPEALDLESKDAKSICRRGKSGWQFALAREMLRRRLGQFDRTLNRVETGAQFIAPEHLPAPEYLTWLERRPEILLRLIKAVAVQCSSELPSVLAATRGESDLEELKESVDQLAMLYDEATRFELSVRAVKPPDDFVNVHRMVYGWSNPVRKGISEFVDILEAISDIDVKRVAAGLDEMPSFEISFAPPPNVDEFRMALDSVNVSAFH